MTRGLYCRECRPGGSCAELASQKALPPADRNMGWKRAFCFLVVTMPDCICDLCGKPITGKIAVAQTMWRSNRGEDHPDWEQAFGTVLTDEAVQMADTLEKQ